MNKDKLKELILALLYETAWAEKLMDEEYMNSWKGYPFEILNELEIEGLLYQSRKSKHITLSEEGINKARRILEALEDSDW